MKQTAWEACRNDGPFVGTRNFRNLFRWGTNGGGHNVTYFHTILLHWGVSNIPIHKPIHPKHQNLIQIHKTLNPHNHGES